MYNEQIKQRKTGSKNGQRLTRLLAGTTAIFCWQYAGMSAGCAGQGKPVARPVIVSVGDERQLGAAAGNPVTTVIRLKNGSPITLTKDLTDVRAIIGFEGETNESHGRRPAIHGTKNCDHGQPCSGVDGHSIRIEGAVSDLDFIRNISFEHGNSKDFGVGIGGGAFYVAGAVVNGIEKSEFVSNNTDQHGGALHVGNGFDGGIRSSVFRNNNATIAGGALYVENDFGGGIDKSEFTMNYAGGTGGAVSIYGDFDGGIKESQFNSNTASSHGGALFVEGRLSGGIENSGFMGNSSGGQFGGAIHAGSLEGGISGSEFIGNNAFLSGGAIYVDGTLAGGIFGSAFKGNSSDNDQGGAVHVSQFTGNIVSSEFIGNRAVGEGGGLAVMENFTGIINSSQFVDNDSEWDGGALHVGETLDGGIHNNSIFKNNSAGGSGGAIFAAAFKGGISTSQFEKNHAALEGGAIYADSTFSGDIKGSEFNENDAAEQGGAIYVGDKLAGAIVGSQFKDNTAGGNGGAIYAFDLAGNIEASQFENNQANGHGGALYIEGALGGVISGSQFKDNSADKNGGAIHAFELEGGLARSVFEGNRALENGGAIYVSGQLSGDILHSEFKKNATAMAKQQMRLNREQDFDGHEEDENDVTHHGGAIYAEDFAGNLRHSHFTGNSAWQNGGALYVKFAMTGDIASSNFSENIAAGDGGALYVGEALSSSISGSAFRDNDASYLGGAIFAYQFAGEIKGSVFTDNESAGWGGALYLGQSDDGQIDNSVFVGNVARHNEENLEGGGLGGAIFSYGLNGDNRLAVTNSAFLKNAAVTDEDDIYGGQGGAIFHNAAENEEAVSSLTIAATQGKTSLFYGNFSRTAEEKGDKTSHANAIYLGNMWDGEREIALNIHADDDGDILMLDPLESQGDEAEDMDENGDDIIYGNLDVRLNKTGEGSWYLGGASVMHSAAVWNIDEGELVLTEVDAVQASITLENERDGKFRLGEEGRIAGTGTIAAQDFYLNGILTPSYVMKSGSGIDNIADEETMDVWVEQTSDYGTIWLKSLTDEAIVLEDVTYVVDVGDEENDRIMAVGDMEIRGGLLDVRSHITSKDENNRYREGSYVIMESEDGTISGEFATIKDDLAFWKAHLDYLGGQIVLDFVRDDTGAREGCLTDNQCRLGEIILDLEDGHEIKDAIIDMNMDDMRRAYDNLSGEIYASSRTALLGEGSLLHALSQRMTQLQHSSGTASSLIDAPWNTGPVWFSAFAHDGHLFGNGEAAGMRHMMSGMAVGLDGDNDEGIFTGFFLGAGKQRLTHGSGRNARADIETRDAGFYVGGEVDGFHLDGGMIYSLLDIKTERDIWVGGKLGSLEGTAKADIHGRRLQLFGEISTDVTFGPALAVSPYLQISQTWLHTASAHESGTPAALDIAAQTDSLFSTHVGVRGIYELSAPYRIRLTGELGWTHGFRRDGIDSQNHLRSADRDFRVEGVDFERDAGFVGFGASAILGDNISLDAGYQGKFGHNLTEHGGSLQLKLKF